MDVELNTVSETTEYHHSPYVWSIDDNQLITIEDTEQNLTRELTLEDLAENNSYAQKLLELSTKQTWDGTSLTDRFFSYIKIIDQDIYIVCQVYNWNGESTAVIFRYDFSSDNVLYVSSYKTGDIVQSNYSFVVY